MKLDVGLQKNPFGIVRLELLDCFLTQQIYVLTAVLCLWKYCIHLREKNTRSKLYLIKINFGFVSS